LEEANLYLRLYLSVVVPVLEEWEVPVLRHAFYLRSPVS
jgi:hypothetical protein